MRTDQDQIDFIYEQLRSGFLRQGWGSLPEQNLDLIRESIRLGRARTESQKQAWRRNRRLHPRENDSVQIGDIVLLLLKFPHVTGWIVVEVTGGYHFQIHDVLGDYGHIREVQMLNPVAINPDLLGVAGARLRNGLKNRLPLWNIDALGSDIEVLLASQSFGTSGRMMTDAERYPLLVVYGLHKVIKNDDDPKLWEAILRSHWGPPENLKHDISTLRFRVGPREQNSFVGEGSEVEFSFLRTPGSFTAVPSPQRTGYMAIANFIRVTRPSKGADDAIVHTGYQSIGWFGPGGGRAYIWRHRPDGTWESDEQCSEWIS